MVTSNSIEILSVIKSIDIAPTSENAINKFMDFANHFGFDRFLIMQVVNPYQSDADKAMTHSNWPEDLLEERFSRQKVLHDPVVQFGLRSRFPFEWADAYRHASKYGRKIMDETRHFNLLVGFSIPMRRPGVPIGGVSLGAESYELSVEQKADLELASMHLYSRLEKLHPHRIQQPTAELSPQETDVLQFSVLGKSAWEIATILDITESGVKKALHRARKKLDAVNTIQACASAIAQDYILP